MILRNVYNQIVLAIAALIATPVLALAASGMPTFSLDGISDIQTDRVTVNMSYDSTGADYTLGEAPITYIEYMNTNTGELLVAPYNQEWEGIRSRAITLYSLEPGTQYSYQAVMKYNGGIYRTPAKTFTTRSKNSTNTTTASNQTTTETNNNSFNIGVAANSLANKASVSAKSKVMTGGATHKNGIAISISDEQARTTVGDMFVFTVKYENLTSKSLQNTELVIKLPEQYEFVKSSFDMDYNERDNTVTYISGRVAPKTLKTVTFTARAIGDGNADVKTTATLFYEGGNISASDRDSFHGGSKSYLGASIFGVGFFPQTLGGWLAIIILIVLIIIVARRYMVAQKTT